MFEMFDWLDMINNYEQRMVKNDETEKFIIDTAQVTDRSWKYETAVAHDDFNDGAWIILEGTNTKEEALQVHNKWLNKLLTEDITELVDCFTDEVYTKE